MPRSATRLTSMWRMAGWALFALTIPLTVLASLLPANQYDAALGLAALDCDGPLQVYVLGLPSLAILLTGLAVQLRYWRRDRRVWRITIALLAAVLAAAVLLNLGQAVVTDRPQQQACSAQI